MYAAATHDFSYSDLIGATIPYDLADDDFRCPTCRNSQKAHWWISLAGECMHCGNCWSNAYTKDADGNIVPYVDDCLDLLFTSVAEQVALQETAKPTNAVVAQ